MECNITSDEDLRRMTFPKYHALVGFIQERQALAKNNG